MGMMSGKKKLPSKEKAKEILKDGSVRGQPISPKQRGLFGLIASGKKTQK